MTLHHPAHPGESIRDCLKESGLTVTELADKLGMDRSTLHRLLAGRIALTARTALALERLGWSTARHWLRMQGAFDLARERRREAAA